MNNLNILNERIIENCLEIEYISKFLRDSYGPYGGIKIIGRISDDKNQDGSDNLDRPSLISTINNIVTKDSMTIIRSLNIDSPIYQILIDPLLKHKQKYGNGIGQIVILLNQILKRCSSILSMVNINPQIIVEILNRCKISINKYFYLNKEYIDTEEKLESIVKTSLSGNVLFEHYKLTSSLIKQLIDIVGIGNLYQNYHIQSIIGNINANNNSNFVGKVIDGFLFKETFSYAGSVYLPKFIENVKILLLDIDIELKYQKEFATLEINNIEDYSSFINAEKSLFLNSLENIYNQGINVVLSTKSIGDFATQEFVKKKIYCCGRIDRLTMNRIQKALGGVVQSTLLDLSNNISFYGYCDTFRQILISNDKYNQFSINSNSSDSGSIVKSKFSTILLGGATRVFLEEAEIGLRDTIKVVNQIFGSKGMVVTGGGSIEASLINHLESIKNDFTAKESLVIDCLVESLQSMIVILANNCGLNGPQLLLELLSQTSNNNSKK